MLPYKCTETMMGLQALARNGGFKMQKTLQNSKNSFHFVLAQSFGSPFFKECVETTS